jgi:hypothetical protein
MFTLAFLQQSGNGQLRLEERLLKSEFERRGIPVALYTLKRILRRNLPLSRDTFIAGDMDAMHGAMRQLNIQVPPPNDYPRSLDTFLHRRIWKSTLGAIEQAIVSDAGAPVFVKPAQRQKNFTGRVFTSIDDFWYIGGVSRRQEVWCSRPVIWHSEFRVYVIDGEIVSIDHYAGDAETTLDLQVLKAALAVYQSSGEAPAAYGIDFGLLGTGETALIEANDGYALGAYSIAAQPYTDLLIRRWSELLSTIV